MSASISSMPDASAASSARCACARPSSAGRRLRAQRRRGRLRVQIQLLRRRQPHQQPQARQRVGRRQGRVDPGPRRAAAFQARQLEVDVRRRAARDARADRIQQLRDQRLPLRRRIDARQRQLRPDVRGAHAGPRLRPRDRHAQLRGAQRPADHLAPRRPLPANLDGLLGVREVLDPFSVTTLDGGPSGAAPPRRRSPGWTGTTRCAPTSRAATTSRSARARRTSGLVCSARRSASSRVRCRPDTAAGGSARAVDGANAATPPAPQKQDHQGTETTGHFDLTSDSGQERHADMGQPDGPATTNHALRGLLSS